MINKDRLISLFIELVSIDSESGDEVTFANHMVNLGKKLGLSSRLDEYSNVYIDLPGAGEPLMLNTHMDTVKPGRGIRPFIKGGYIQTDNTTILGADSKSGIACMLEAIKVIQENGLKNRKVQITLTCNEESGFPTAPYIRSNIKNCVVVDRGTPLGEVIPEAPYAQVFEVTIKGRSAYATTNFDKGKHAILAASKIISEMPLGNFDEGATSNVGLINGGVMTTTVPDICVFKGNCYAFNQESIGYFFEKLKSVIKSVDKEIGTKTSIKMLEYFGGYKLDEQDWVVGLAKKAIKKAGLNPRVKIYKAVTNANNLNSIGIKSTLISYGVEDQHTVRERISIDNLIKLGEIVLNLMLVS